MMIKLGARIKELRLRDGRTQETLAGELGVTAQAVSRWEKEICYPDMEVIPSIANYFGVSIDELFGYDNERSKKVDELAEQIKRMNRQNDGRDVNMNECIALARNALIEFPGNEKLTLELASALYNAGYVRHGEHHLVGEDGFSVYDVERHKNYSEWQEAVKLYEKLLLSLTGGEMRERAVVECSQLYKNIGEQDKALRLAESAPSIQATDILLRIKAFDGKDAVAACGEALLESVKNSAELMVRIVLTDGTISPQKAADILQNAAGMFDLIYLDHDYGEYHGLVACIHMLRSYYLWLSDNQDDSFISLDNALDHAQRFDCSGESKNEYFTSPLLQYVKIEPKTEKSNFSQELPDLWPWWDVPEREKVKSEMQADSRWKNWLRKIEQN